MISRQFLKSSLIYSVVGALPYVSGIVLLPFLTNFMTPEQVGANELYLTFLYFIQIIASFSLDFYVSVHYFDHREDKKKMGEMIGTAMISLGILALLIVSVLLVFGNGIFALVFDDEVLFQFFPFGIITVFTAIFNGFFKTYAGLLVNQQRPQRFFWLNLTNFLMVMVFSVLILKLFPFTLYGPVLGRMIPSVITFSIVMFMLFHEFEMRWNRGFLKSIAGYCFPLLVYTISIWTVNYIDRYMIEHFLGDLAMLGVYSIAVKITLVIEFFQVGLNASIQPKVFNQWKEKGLTGSSPEVNRYYHGLTGATILMIPLVVLAAPLFIPMIIHKPVYYLAFAFIPFIGVGFATRGWFYMFIAPLFYFKKTKVLPKIFLISAVIQIIMTYLLIRYFSLWGAVTASLLIKPVQAFLIYFEARKIFSFSFNKWKIFYMPVIFMVVFLALQYFSNENNRILTASVQLAFTIILVFLVYRRELIPLIRKKIG